MLQTIVTDAATKLRSAIIDKQQKEGYKQWPSVIRISDDNMVRDPRKDFLPPEPAGPSKAHAAMDAFMRAISPNGMKDAYRHTDPEGDATTYR